MGVTLVTAGTSCVVGAATPYTQVPASCVDGGLLTKQRWYSAESASSGVKHANTVADAYTALKATYETNAATYNTYLAALVTPPDVKPTLVLRPSKPEMPAAFTGLQHWTATK